VGHETGLAPGTCADGSVCASTCPETPPPFLNRCDGRSAASCLAGFWSKDGDPSPGLQRPSPALGGGLSSSSAGHDPLLTCFRLLPSPLRGPSEATDAPSTAQCWPTGRVAMEEEGQRASAQHASVPESGWQDGSPAAVLAVPSVPDRPAWDPLTQPLRQLCLDPSEGRREAESSSVGRFYLLPAPRW